MRTTLPRGGERRGGDELGSGTTEHTTRGTTEHTTRGTTEHTTRGAGALTRRGAVWLGAALVTFGACVVAGATLGSARGGPDDDASGGVTRPWRESPPRTTTPVTSEAEAALGRLRQAGLPVESVRVVTRSGDPDRLLGYADGYRSKLSFEDRRVNGGLVVDNDPGSVSLGGVIEVFPDAVAARERAEQLQRDARGIPPKAERGFLAGRVLLRLSPYLADAQALEYGRALGARPVPTLAPPQNLRDV
ncbi:hypothetical protein [Streptomyces sp. JJ38]|uniref:hypothetical protein n=1 Tax=Streptomyces sp. JJ38 TaxID=2738128 RepID=UPI001C5A4790|nr:hypothetical protein [Streptomyces sp. JJ38]